MIGLLIDLYDMLRGDRKKKVLGNVVARLKHKDFVSAVREHLRKSGKALTDAELAPLLPLTRPFAGDLVIAYALDGKDEWRFVGQDFLAANKLSLDQVHEAALANASSLIVKHIRIGQMQNFMGVDSAAAGIASSIALLPEFWKPFERKHGCDLLAVIPGRDFVAFLPLAAAGPAREKALVQALIMKRSAIAAFEESGNHALSEFSFCVRDGRFQVSEQLGEQSEETTALLATARGAELLAECGVS